MYDCQHHNVQSCTRSFLFLYTFTFYLWLVWHLCCPVLWRIRGRWRKVQGVTTQRKLSLKHWQYLCNGDILYIHLTCVIVLFYCVALYAVQCTEKQVCCRWKRSCRTDALVLFSHWEAFWKHNWNWVKKPAEKGNRLLGDNLRGLVVLAHREINHSI